MNANRYQFNSVVRMFAALDEDTANKVADVISAARAYGTVNGTALVATFKHKAASIERVKRNAAPSAESIRNARVRARLVDIINAMPDDAEVTASDLEATHAADLDHKSAKAIGVLLAAAVRNGEVQASPYHKAPKVYANVRHEFKKPEKKKAKAKQDA